MNSKIGIKESTRMIVFLILPQVILHQISIGLIKLNNGLVYNYIIYSIIFFALIKLMKKSFVGDKSSVNSVFEKFVDILYIAYILFMTLYNFGICSEALFFTSSGVFSKNAVIFLPFISAVICALLGVESISRTSYMAFYIVGLLLIFIIFLTFSGWSTENIYPVFGTNRSKIFTEFSSLGCFSGVVAIYFLKGSFKDKGGAYTIVKNASVISFVFGFTIIILCILSIPYPMGDLYKFSLNGIFSVAKSGSFFHRFELLVMFLMLILQILSTAVGLYLLSASTANILGLDDYKPFCLLFGMIIFYVSLIPNCVNVVRNIYYALSALLIILLIIKPRFKPSERKE